MGSTQTLEVIQANSSKVEEIIAREANKLVSWYLIASYAYYKLDETIISDDLFDRICVRLLEEMWLLDHVNLDLVRPGDLEAGTGFRIKNYPLRVRVIAHKLLLKGID